MAGICCGVVGEGETTAPIEPTSRPSRRRSLDMLSLRLMTDVASATPHDASRKRQRMDLCAVPRECDNAVENRNSFGVAGQSKNEGSNQVVNHEDGIVSEPKRSEVPSLLSMTAEVLRNEEVVEEYPKFGVTSVCGRRRDMEDSVCVRPSFCYESHRGFHYFGVFDGHGCSHVATMCKEKLHDIVKDEIRGAKKDEQELEWKSMMEKGFSRMDDEVQSWSQGNHSSACRCELQTPHCDAVGSTAAVAVVTPDKIVVSNCGDSRAVLCRKGRAIPLSSDHKPDRPDELLRVQAAGGRVIYWDVPRVLGMLAMSRAIGDNYLKPYVISEPEVTVTERSDDDECLIIASDGLWDVVSNDTACGVVRMCLKAQKPPSPPGSPSGSEVAADGSDRACSDASILLTKLALARHSEDNVSVVVVDLRRDRSTTV
ncbi:hypothetical protein PIB30_005427 [Stylosanthes scabra]|uniref:protein-serine/threonine phosphatase n=1 Tax=Stylosanthes scabra TaxID=79078 RepID=A0ABU6X3K5_9FABA|nr:hypothetical protein [Stylosanthes scabra]